MKVAVFLIGLAFAAAPACASMDKAEALFQEGLSLYERGDDGAAVDRFSQALLLNPHDARIQRYLTQASARLMQREGEGAVSVQELEKILEQARNILDQRRKDMARVLREVRLAHTQSLSQEPQTLLRACRGVDLQLEVALGDDPQSLKIKRYLHSLCANLEKSAAAGPWAAPEDVQRVLGYVAFCDSRWEEAVQHWEEAQRLNPRDRSLRLPLERARENAARAEVLRKTSLWMAEVEEKISQGREREALPLLEQVLALDPGHKKALLLGEKLRNQVRKADREASLRNLKSSALENQSRGRWLEAAQYWMDVLELDPLQEEALKHLSKIKGRLAAAARAPVSPEDHEKSRGLYTLGLLQYADGDLREALKSFEASLKLDTDNEYAQRALKRVREELRYK